MSQKRGGKRKYRSFALIFYLFFYYYFDLIYLGFALLIFSIISSFVVVIFLVCPCFSFARKTPTNYILLFLFTACEGYMVSYSCAVTEKSIVLMAAAMTLGVTVSLTIYAYTTKQDFTMMGGILFVISAVFFMFGFFLLFTNIYFLHVIYSALGVILYGVYLIYDTQLILGGKHQELSIDDYIVGALMLYLDIIMIFLYILDLFSRKD